MAVGQVSFHNDKKVKRGTYPPSPRPPSSLIPHLLSIFLRPVCLVHVPKRENPIINRLNKTKVERQVDHEQERQDRIRRENAAKRAAAAAKVCILSSRLTPSPSITIRTFFPFQLFSVFLICSRNELSSRACFRVVLNRKKQTQTSPNSVKQRKQRAPTIRSSPTTTGTGMMPTTTILSMEGKGREGRRSRSMRM